MPTEKKYFVWSTDPLLTSHIVSELRKKGLNVEMRKEGLSAEAESESTKAQEAQYNIDRPFEGTALTQADGYAASGSEDASFGVREDKALALIPSGFFGRADYFADGKRGITEKEQVPIGEAARGEAHQDVLGVARQFLAEPLPTPFYAPSNSGPEELGTIAALNDIFGTVREVIEFAVPSCRSKSLALTKLDEASMWANKAVAKKE